ncbi:MAG: hypothetical protein D6687_08815 [Acidobacteria bacterium]|jgi:hypothetical protein|nr:MAG: hypothetical protein D6687_08815 [Acidobacteriota bacterium]GIU82241.1 MAG: hypothetical protein KatS3mg006_1305 [Pyrinomonadaceae bacterium]
MFARKVFALTLFLALLVFNTTPIFVASAQQEERNRRNRPSEAIFKADTAKLASLDPSKALWRIDIQSPEDKTKIKRKATIIEDYGAFVIAATAKNNLLGDFDQKIRLETTINLPGSRFEPLSDSKHSLRENLTDEKDYYIVQFVAPVRDKWFEDLKEIGAEFIQYVPHNAFFVYANAEQINRISNYYRVRWIGHYLAEDKISPVLRAQLENARSGKALPENISPIEVNQGNVRMEIAVFARAELQEVARQIEEAASAKIEQATKLPSNFFNYIRAELPLDQVEKIATLKDVFTVEAFITPQPEDERAAQIVAGNYLSQTQLFPPGYNPLNQFGVTGQNVTVSVVDDGVSIPGNGGYYITANNTVNALSGATAGASGGHGHINASIIAGTTPYGPLDPLNYNYGLGVAPGANIINIPFLKAGYMGSYPQTLNDTVMTAGVNGVRGNISNNSWGSGTNSNAYDSLAAQYDGYVRDASFASTIDPVCVVFSAGNSGTSGLTRPKVAKNIIAVANSENIRTEISSSADNIDDLNSSSSRGPAADGRIKPDITAPGTVISGSRAGDGSSVSGQIDQFHSWSTGTSHAAPQVAGAAALFTEFWKNSNFGQNPSPALIKAALINGTVDMNGVGTTAPIPNGAEGWGRINMKNVLATGVPIQYINQTVEFTDVGQSFAITGTVANSSKPFRVTLVWTDPPGTTDPALVNNLDLTVTVGGQVYRGNVFSNGVSTTGGTADTRNNVENVFLPPGISAGTQFTIQITATALNGDGILGNGDPTDQHFALVIFNGENISSFQRPIADFDGDGRTDISVFRPSEGIWYLIRSQNGQFSAFNWGQSNDTIVAADYDGDGKTDYGVYRNGVWYLQRSQDGVATYGFVLGNDIPVPGYYDSDLKADLAVWRQSNGTWYILRSSDGGFQSVQFGTNGDKPIPADMDGDGRTDFVVFRGGTWFILRSSNGSSYSVQFGLPTDKPVVADYDGDSKADIAVFRPSDGTWYILRSSDNQLLAIKWGISSDLLAPGNYDGDSKTDIAVFRPSEGTWYILRSSDSQMQAMQFGASNDIPIPSVGY